ncbi:myocardin-related transcription factor A-like isoform X2 [Anneissia japonica]|uniref:myocardin-related transcription factor A-like isoform X2 n=1 Tax=Anneissia japonica TaxID=1529436 RepID=UPI0014259C67|nr:myocardin-related transcription factor A-like isoform X2 [Anneissia japonica]
MDYTSRVLALRLKLRRPREELVSQGIMPPLKTPPAFHEQRQRLERAKVGDCLQRKIRMRPDKTQLINQHILEDTSTDPLVSATHQRLKRARLERDLEGKIKNRPGPLELIEENILKTDNLLVEQAIKDGKVMFMKTNSMDVPNMVDEDSQEVGSDEAPSPSQSEASSVQCPDNRFNGVPSPPDIGAFFERLKSEQVLSPVLTVSALTSFQDSGLTSPQQVTPPTPSLFSMPSPNHTKTSSSSSSSSSKSRKKQAKRPKPKEIKFHEYKPPNEVNSKSATSATDDDNPYNLLLMQQQLFLQLQLLQQQQAMQQQQQQQPSNQKESSSVGSIGSPGGSVDSVQATPLKVGKITGNLEDMKVAELKIELKARGLHVSGTKPQLVERLRPYTETSASRSNSTSSTYDVPTSSPQAKVSSSTDFPLDAMSDISAPPSVSTPPVSPPDAKQLASVKSEPMSPGNVFMDPMSPLNLQGKNDSSIIITSQNTHEERTLHRTLSSSSIRSKTIPMDMDSNSNIEQCLPDLISEDTSVNDSSDLVKQQQRKIEELQQQLLLSQMQIQQQKQQLQSRPPPPPPPPPPPQGQSQTVNLQLQKKLAPQTLIPGLISTVPTQLSAGQVTVTNSSASVAPVGQPPAFQVSQTFAPTTKVLSFGVSSPSQQFTFPKHTIDTKPVSIPNGLFASQKASSLPNSPTDVIADTPSLSRSMTNPAFSSPPPRYEDAIRQTKIKNGNQGGNSRSTHTQDLDDLLEVLVDHGYQIPSTPRNRGQLGIANSFPQTITLTQSPQRIHLASSPPKSPSAGRRATASNSMSRSMPPSHMTTELPMDIDAELSLGTIDLGVVKSERLSPADINKDIHQSNSLDITMMDSDSNILGLSNDPLTDTCASSSDTNVDNWLDLVIPSSGSGLTPVSCTPPAGLSIDNVLGNPLGKDPFSLNLFDLGEISTPTELHHLEGDGWDNIPVGE